MHRGALCSAAIALHVRVAENCKEKEVLKGLLLAGETRLVKAQSG